MTRLEELDALITPRRGRKTGPKLGSQRRIPLAHLATMYSRPCFVCDRRGQCDHREPEVELAHLAAHIRALEGRTVRQIVASRMAVGLRLRGIRERKTTE